MLLEIWKEFLEIARQEAGNQVVDTWLKAVIFVNWDSLNHIAHIKAPNSFVRDWIKINYLNLLTIHLSRLLNVAQLKIVFFTEHEQPSDNMLSVVQQGDKDEIKNLNESIDVMSNKSGNIVPGKLPVAISTNLVAKKNHPSINPNYQFATFVVGPSNSLAHAAALAVAERPGYLYNPLFIYGSSGLGKTHLLHAIGNRIKVDHPSKVVIYQTADRFVNEFISAIRFNRMFAFREKYKLVDVLLIDDVQFIANKDQTQEAFFHIFNSLYDAHKQIVLSSDCYPKDLKGITERLRSRMEWGLVTDIYVPTVETKIAILKKKAEQSQQVISDEVANLIANQANANIRQLEGCLVRVIAFAHLTGQPINRALVLRVLGAVVEPLTNTISFDRIAQTVASNYSYTLDQLRSRERGRDLSFVRQLAMFLMKELTNRPLREIGQFLGRSDHSTVIHAIHKIGATLKCDLKLQQEIASFKKELGF